MAAEGTGLTQWGVWVLGGGYDSTLHPVGTREKTPGHVKHTEKRKSKKRCGLRQHHSSQRFPPEWGGPDARDLTKYPTDGRSL